MACACVVRGMYGVPLLMVPFADIVLAAVEKLVA